MTSLSTVTRCRRCHVVYQVGANFGTHGCLVHPGALDAATGRYTCCQIHPVRTAREDVRMATGCLRCDHDVPATEPPAWVTRWRTAILRHTPGAAVRAPAKAPARSPDLIRAFWEHTREAAALNEFAHYVQLQRADDLGAAAWCQEFLARPFSDATLPLAQDPVELGLLLVVDRVAERQDGATLFAGHLDVGREHEEREVAAMRA